MPTASIVAMIPSSLLIAAVCYVAALPVCSFYWGMFPPGFKGFNWQAKDAFGFVIFFVIVNIVVAVVIAVITTFSFRFVARLTKMRNPRIGAWFAFFSVAAVCFLLYVPLFGQSTLSEFWPSPFYWVLIGVGCLGIPYMISSIVGIFLYGMKYCEMTGMFLKRAIHAKLSWDDGKALIQALKDKSFDSVPAMLKRTRKVSPNPVLKFELFGHPDADVAYIDILASFTEVIGNATNSTTTSWLAYHQRLSKEEASRLLMPSGLN
jgi:hypothetical protein